MDEKKIIAAYKQAEKLFLDGSLPERKQLLNLYIHRIIVFPEQVEILLNNIPPSHLIPTKEEGILPAVIGGQDALHKFLEMVQIKNKSAQNIERTSLKLAKNTSLIQNALGIAVPVCWVNTLDVSRLFRVQG
ncbi:MAG: hypothetical protein PHV95_01500 [Eubacteriales bacterium]|nr:hypothetical protein [Eubacteriales bacterium]